MHKIAKRLRTLRESLNLSQMKLASLIGTTQASVNRYEMGQSTPPAKTLLWYADFFDVSLDYIFGRTDKSQGVLYTAEPKIIENQPQDNKELQAFIEMCFDPKSPMNGKLKESLLKMAQEQSK